MDINKIIQDIAILGPPFLLAITLHELAHGYVASRLGDPTARLAGRLTLNPLKHLDPLGVLCFLLIKIGWAKPVPVNPSYFKNPEKDMLKVSLAGPGANMALALASAVLVKVLLAIPLLPEAIFIPLARMLVASVWINIMLAVFNFLPIPPLDGGKILAGLLPRQYLPAYAHLERYGFIILLLLFYSGILSRLLLPIISYAHELLLG